MKKAIPVLIAVALILLVGGFYAGQQLLEKYSYSSERADAAEYFGVRDDADVPILMAHELIEAHARLFDGHCYMTAADVDAILCSRFYAGEADQMLIYTMPTEMVYTRIGEKTWESTDGSSGTLDCPIARMENDTLYIALDYVQRFANFDYMLYRDPNRMLLFTEWVPEKRAPVNKDTSVRVRGGVKSEILTDLEKGDQVEILEELENWSKVQTEDGFIGYVENKRLSDPIEYQRIQSSPVEIPEYTSISKPYQINMVWHLVAGKSGNSTVESLVAATNAGAEGGLNTISPTWFCLSDDEGGITSFAEESYVNFAHSKGLEVWGMVDNFTGEGDGVKVLAHLTYRKALIDALIDEAQRVGLDGINVDFEAVPSSSGEDFIEFIRELSIACRKNKLVLSVDNYVPMGSLNDHYDRAEQGVVADYVIVMGYDEHYKGSPEAGSVASIGYVEDGIRRTVAEVPASKVIGGMPFYTRVWATSNGEIDSSALGMADAAQWVKDRGLTLTWDETTCQNYGEFKEKDGTLRQIWMEDAESIRTKVTVMETYDIAGVAAWQLGYETPDVWDVITAAMKK